MKLPGSQRPVTLPGEVTEFAFAVELACTSFVRTFLEEIIPPMYNGKKTTLALGMVDELETSTTLQIPAEQD